MNKLSKEQLVKEITKHTSSFDVKSLTRTSPDNLRVIIDLLGTVEDAEKSQVVREEAYNVVGLD